MSSSTKPMYFSFNKLSNVMVFYRVKDWPHILGLIALGLAYTQKSINLPLVFLLLLIGSTYLAHGYSLNDIFDNQIKTPLSKTQAFAFSIGSLLICLVLSAFISYHFFLTVLFGHLCGMLYSAKPFRFKNKLGLDLIFNALSLAPLFLLGCLSTAPFTLNALVTTSFFVMYFIPIQLLHEIDDNKIDKEHQQQNTFQILGLKKTLNLFMITLCCFAVMSLFMWFHHIFNLLSSLLTILFSITLMIHIKFKFPSGTMAHKNQYYHLKLNSRYVSIVYGSTLFLSFYWPHG